MDTISGDLWEAEQFMLCRDDETGLRAIIVIDDTMLGPAVGGVRFRAYPSGPAAVRECRRLAAGMTLKNAAAELPFGGAKSVILDSDAIGDREALMRRFGDFVAQTAGAYIPGVDMGTTTQDLAAIGFTGAEVACSEEDPSPWTALGVGAAIRAAVEHVDARGDLEGVRVLVQGAGHVGSVLATELAGAGALILVSDIDGERAVALAAAVGGSVVAPEAALTTECDVLAPCAIARVLGREMIGQLRCRIVAGAANDTLADPECAALLAERGITYVPDFVASAGGVIQINALRERHDEDRLRADVLRIGDRVRGVLAEASSDGGVPVAVAEARARRRITETTTPARAAG